MTMGSCKVCDILSNQSTTVPERKSLALALKLKDGDNYVWSAKTLALTITDKTRFSVGETTIKKHRRECMTNGN